MQLKGTRSSQSYVRMTREEWWDLILLAQAYAKPTPALGAEQEGVVVPKKKSGTAVTAEVVPSIRQASWLADEGEELEAIVQRMDLEDQDYNELSEDEGSDDEDDVY